MLRLATINTNSDDVPVWCGIYYGNKSIWIKYNGKLQIVEETEDNIDTLDEAISVIQQMWRWETWQTRFNEKYLGGLQNG